MCPHTYVIIRPDRRRRRRLFLRRTAVFLRKNTALPWNSLLVSCRRVSFWSGEPMLDREGRYLNAAASRFHGTCLFFHGTCTSFHGKASHFYAEAACLHKGISVNVSWSTGNTSVCYRRHLQNQNGKTAGVMNISSTLWLLWANFSTSIAIRTVLAVSFLNRVQVYC